MEDTCYKAVEAMADGDERKQFLGTEGSQNSGEDLEAVNTLSRNLGEVNTSLGSSSIVKLEEDMLTKLLPNTDLESLR